MKQLLTFLLIAFSFTASAQLSSLPVEQYPKSYDTSKYKIEALTDPRGKLVYVGKVYVNQEKRWKYLKIDNGKAVWREQPSVYLGTTILAKNLIMTYKDLRDQELEAGRGWTPEDPYRY